MQTILNQLKINADIVKIENNGTMSKYFLRLHPGSKVSKIENCSTEIALGLKSYSRPIVRVITEEGLVSVEVLTKPLSNVMLSEFINDLRADKSKLPLVLGKKYDGENLIVDLATMPHLLVAGTTGSGKSVLLHSILSSLILSRPVKFVLVDPKQVEFKYYSDIKQLMYPVITDPDDALGVLSDLLEEMEQRFKIMSRAAVNNIEDFNIKKSKILPYIVFVIDEFSDLMAYNKKVFQRKLALLAQKSRASGIHIIIATQRPSVDVVTGLIKANFPGRISCQVSTKIDSRVILDCNGAEKLLGKGDSLIRSIGYDMVRFKGAYIGPEDIQKICKIHKRGKINNIINWLRGIK